jgi:PAS domain-containing protein
VGYFTLDEKGLIIETNLTAANMIGSTRKALLKKPITWFIFKDDQDIYYLYHKQISGDHSNRFNEIDKRQRDIILNSGNNFGSDSENICELRMKCMDGTIFPVYMPSKMVQDGQGPVVFHVVIMNIEKDFLMHRNSELM